MEAQILEAKGKAEAIRLVAEAEAEALRTVGSRKVEKGASSTDANIPLADGAAAVCLGIANSGNVHRTDEYLDFTNFPKGMGQVLLVALAAADFGQF